MDAILDLVASGPIAEWLGGLFGTELGKLSIMFILAAAFHRKTVKKEFGLLRESIDHLSAVLGKRIDGLESRIDDLEND